MTETSWFWQGTVTGDASLAPYSDDEWTDIWRKLFLRDRTTMGVVRGAGNELQVAEYAANIVSVATGSALVDGKYYKNSAIVTVNIPTPVTNTRIDRIVLRKDWAAETVRITRVAGTEGAGVPAITQTDGTTWDISLAQVSITTAGVMTITSERVFANMTLDDFPTVCCDGRLTLSSSNPTGESASLVTTLYFLPHKGNNVPLYSGKGSFRNFKLPDAGISASLTGLARGGIYDVFIYDNAGTLTLDLTAWTTSTLTGGTAAGAGVTISANNVPATLTQGMVVSIMIASGTTWEDCYVTGVTPGTPGSFTVDRLTVAVAASDVVIYPLRSTAVVYESGVYLKSGALERLYLGTIKIYETQARGIDSPAQRYIWNYFNRVPKSLSKLFDAGYFQSPTVASGWQYLWNASLTKNQAQVAYIKGLRVDGDLEYDMTAIGWSANNGAYGQLVVGVNRYETAIGGFPQYAYGSIGISTGAHRGERYARVRNDAESPPSSQYLYAPGFNVMYCMIRSVTNTFTWGESGVSDGNSGGMGCFWC